MVALIPTTRFEKRLKWKQKHQPFLLPKVESAMRALEASSAPELLGRKKHGDLQDVYGFDLSRDSRLLYKVDRQRQSVNVVLLRVCSHKEVYG